MKSYLKSHLMRFVKCFLKFNIKSATHNVGISQLNKHFLQCNAGDLHHIDVYDVLMWAHYPESIIELVRVWMVL